MRLTGAPQPICDGINPSKKLDGNRKRLHNDKTHLFVGLINARSIVNKISELALYINQFSPDIVCITESWLRPDVSSSEVTPRGYTAYRTDRSLGRGGEDV